MGNVLDAVKGLWASLVNTTADCVGQYGRYVCITQGGCRTDDMEACEGIFFGGKLARV